MKKLEAGYSGKDNMREKAHKMFEKHIGNISSPPESMTAKDNEKTRLYKKGGHAVKRHKMSKEQTDMKIPRLGTHKKLNIERMSKAERNCYADGGPVAGGIIQEPNIDTISPYGINKSTWERSQQFGRNKSTLPRTHYADGGVVQNQPLGIQNSQMGVPQNSNQPSGQPSRYWGRPLMGDMSPFGGSYAPKFTTMPIQTPTMSKGGACYKKGGGVYEREMVGEHPSKKPHNFDYESDMRGEHGHMNVRKPGKLKGHRDNESMGQIKRKGKGVRGEMSHGGTSNYSQGGSAMHQGGAMGYGMGGQAMHGGGNAMHHGGEMGYAMGGPGKMRKGVMSSDGTPTRGHRDDESHHQNRAKGGSVYKTAVSSYESMMRGEHGHMGGTHGHVSKRGRDDESKGQAHRSGPGQRSDMKRGGKAGREDMTNIKRRKLHIPK